MQPKCPPNGLAGGRPHWPPAYRPPDTRGVQAKLSATKPHWPPPYRPATQVQRAKSVQSGVFREDAITNPALSTEQKEEIIRRAKAILGTEGIATTSGEGVGEYGSSGITIRQQIFFDADGLAWEGFIHYDFTGAPHGGIPTPHTQLIRVRAAGTDPTRMTYPIRDATKLLSWAEIQALLANPHECPDSVMAWVLQIMSTRAKTTEYIRNKVLFK